MQPTTIKVLLALFVLVHFVGNLWHGDAHATLEITLPGSKTAFVVVFILIGPILGSILTWTRHIVIGSWIVGVSMLGSVVFSVYHHFVLISPDNVDHLPAGTPAAHAQFSSSAEFIAVAALLTALLAFYAAGKLQPNHSVD
ncbi:MAG: hypothetical protein O7G86_14250 [Gammaproteobacteria bacterium]|nr:hypothetical protein [Gammaproteobacteria bacterium]